MAQSTLGLFTDFKRLRDEIKYINSQFQNLRTFIVPDGKTDRRDLFYFAMFPADGSLSVNDIPLVGKMMIGKSYPKYPPCLHLFNLTGRYNVDVFWQGEKSESKASSMCFDILGRRGEDPYGLWDESITLASVFASLLQSIVSFKVPQKGSDYEREEVVSMEKMVGQHKSSEDIWKRYKHLFGQCPKIAKTHAKRVKVHKPIMFHKEIIPISFTQGKRTFTSSGFRLNSADFCVQIDLTDFRKFKHMEHRYNFVVSFVISNSQTDVVGRNPQTVLIRNGITGTAAKKLKNEETAWFYHGQPLIDYSVIHFTVSHGQVTMVVEKESDEAKSQELNIHGDTVLSYLSAAEIGQLDSSEIFYLNIFVEAKQTLQLALGEPATPDERSAVRKITDEVLNEKDFAIRVNTRAQYGYIHPRTELAESHHQAESSASRESKPIVINLDKLKDGIFSLSLDNFEYLKSLFNQAETREGQVVDRWSKAIQLDECQAYYLRNLLNYFERRFNKDIYAKKMQDQELKRKKASLEERQASMPKPKPVRPKVQSTVLPRESNMSPSEFWSKLRLDTPPRKPVAPVSVASSPAHLQSTCDRDQDPLERIAASILKTPDDQVVPACQSPMPKYSDEYLRRVTFVAIDFGTSSLNIYQDALDLEEKTHLMSKYERLVAPGHVTLAYHRDFFMRQDFVDFLQAFNENEVVLTKIVGYVHDDYALALLVEIDQAQFAHSKVPIHPSNRNLHATVALKSGFTPIYSGRLIQFYIDNVHKPKILNERGIVLKLFDKPLLSLGSIKFFM